MDFYIICACYSKSGEDWRPLERTMCTKKEAIDKAKTHYLTNKWNNVYVALDSIDSQTIIWDAGHDKISGFAWD